MQKNTCFLTEQEARKARKLSGGESVGEQWMEGWREEVGAVRVTSTLCPLDARSLFSFSYIFFAASLNFSAFKSHQIGFLVLASFQQSRLISSCPALGSEALAAPPLQRFAFSTLVTSVRQTTEEKIYTSLFLYFLHIYSL